MQGAKCEQSLLKGHFLKGNWSFRVCVIGSIKEQRHFQARAEHRDKMDAFAVMVADSVISH